MEIFSLCELDGNKLMYETKKYSINQILKKINKLPAKTKIYLPNVEGKYCSLKNQEFYSIFNEVKDSIVYY